MNGKSSVSERRAAERQPSSLMLERYRLGEVTEEERTFVEAELSVNAKLRSRRDALEDSDRELRRLYPLRSLELADHIPARQFAGTRPALGERRNNFKRFRVAGLCAAALLLCVLFPSIYYLRGKPGVDIAFSAGTGGQDRAKGTELKPELSLYLDESAENPDGGLKLSDHAFLKEGNTVQLAYATPPGTVYYGVIFSIDGRSALTLHYPYRVEQSSVLAAGKRTFLSEAYTLDDAPDFETFFMVLSPEPLDTETVLKTAGTLAKEPGSVLEKCAAAFNGCQVETITVRKQK
jgi:hypothetical protein